MDLDVTDDKNDIEKFTNSGVAYFDHGRVTLTLRLVAMTTPK